MRRLGIAIALLALAGCGGTRRQQSAPKTITLSSPAFAPGGAIPKPYACPQSTSPPLRWSPVPAGTRELALEMIDPDAPGGPFVHWSLARLSPSLRGLAAGQTVPPGAVAGRNSRGTVGYYGPCPPPGETHHYVITLLALSAESGLSSGFPIGALPSQALARGVLTGTYRRP